MEEHDLFFGASPNLKKQLRVNKDQKKFDLDKMAEKKRALELDDTADPKVGKVVKLIDLAMDKTDEFKPKCKERRTEKWVKIDDLGLTIMPKKLPKS
jgi:hypothetical protein